MEKFIVDRIVGDIAVLEKEDLSHIEIICSDIGFDVFQGDVILFDGETYSKDLDIAAERRNRLLDMQEKLKKKSNNS